MMEVTLLEQVAKESIVIQWMIEIINTNAKEFQLKMIKPFTLQSYSKVNG
jgi:hypothetical protein